jgi:flagellin
VNAGSGGLGALTGIDVSTGPGATAALAAVESLIDTSIDASAAFGSAQGRIETQKEFISNLSDSFKSGIGSLVDANMEETSARLQALQVQQQLATQSLSIANQAPQSILSLFR